MRICGVAIGKRRVELALVQHYDYISLEGGTRFKLEGQQTIFVPKHFAEQPLDITYKIEGIKLFKDADFIHILHGSDKNTKEETVALKHVVHTLLVEHIESIKKGYYSEKARVLQYRMGKRKFMSYLKVLDWLLLYVDNFGRQKTMGRRGVMVSKTMAIAAACDRKTSKYDFWK